MRARPDVLVIGGGVVGCAVARAAALAGLAVLCVDRGALGGEASGAAAGVLAVGSGAEEPGPGLELRRASLACFPVLAAALHEATGIDVELEASGVLELLLDDAAASAASARMAARRAAGFAVERLEAGALRAAAPGAPPAARGALAFADDAVVHPGRLVDALAAAARGRGAELVPGAAVEAVAWAGRRIERVRVGAEWVSPGAVVLAAGAWTPRLPGVTPAFPVVPVRGQMLALRPSRRPSALVLAAGDGYVVPRRDGEVWIGATLEQAGFVRAVTPAGLVALHEKLAALAPGLRDAAVTRAWAGLRPWAPAGGPLIGRPPDADDLIVATGHHRSGILLAPITAAVVLALLIGGTPPVDAAAFLPPAARGA